MKHEQDICRLCLRQSKLCESHIIPEFFFRFMYDEDNRALMVEPKTMRESKVQSGFKERMLCLGCESRINKFETYAARIWHKEFPRTIEGKMFTMTNLDYAKFRLLHLSILLKASFSKLDFFRQVSLGQKHEEILRQMILSEDPGKPTEYAFMPHFIYLKEKVLHAVFQPLRGRNGALTQYRFCFGGLVWDYIVGSVPATSVYPKYPFFSEDGRLYIITEDVFDNPQFNFNWAKPLRKEQSLEKLRESREKRKRPD